MFSIKHSGVKYIASSTGINKVNGFTQARINHPGINCLDSANNKTLNLTMIKPYRC